MNFLKFCYRFLFGLFFLCEQKLCAPLNLANQRSTFCFDSVSSSFKPESKFKDLDLEGESVTRSFPFWSSDVPDELTRTSITTATYTLTDNVFLTPSSTLDFSGQATIAFDGDGMFVHFPYTTVAARFTVAASLDLAVTNIVFKDFNPDAVSIGAGSSITYGDGVKIELGQDIYLDGVADSWVFNGDAEIDGNGFTLTIDKAQAITVTGTKTLSFKNMTIRLENADAIRCLDDDAIIELDNVTFILDLAGYTFSQGSLYIRNFVKITGGIGGGVGRTDFSLTTKNILYVQAFSELWIDPNINLLYDVDPSLDTTLAETKNHIQFEQVQSVLTLNGASLTSTATGILLDIGTLHVIDKVDINPTIDAAAEFEFGQQLQVNMSAGAVINLTGPATYAEVPPPPTLSYGDIVLVSHKTHNFNMWAIHKSGTDFAGQPNAATNWYPSAADYQNVGSSDSLPGLANFHNYSGGQEPIISIQTGADETFLTSPDLGAAIKSGDMIKLQYMAAATTGRAIRYLVFGYQHPGNNQYFSPPITINTLRGASVSAPTPPYVVSSWGNEGGGHKMGMRIYKHGAALGDTIFEGDDVYFQSFMYTNDIAPELIYRPAYLGSSNLQLTTGSNNYSSATLAIITGNDVREIYWYLGSTAVEVPPNFSTDFLWNISINQAGGYSTYSSYIPLDTDANSNATYGFGAFSGWPAASGYQY